MSDQEKDEDEDNRRSRIKALIDGIRMDAKKRKRGKKKPVIEASPVQAAPAASAKSNLTKGRKRYTLHLGWSHYSKGKHRVVTCSKGGGTRTFTYERDEPMSVEKLLDMGKKLFFPENKSVFGSLEDMNVSLGNLSGADITVFKDLEGNECSFQEYLHSNGLFSSQFHVYFKTRLNENGTENSKEHRFVVNGQEPGRMSIKYRKRLTSLFNDEPSFISCWSTDRCIEHCSTPEEMYSPCEDGYSVSSMEIDGITYIKEDELNDVSVFPQVTSPQQLLILHGPDEIFGYECDKVCRLYLGVVVNGDQEMYFSWCKDGQICGSGPNMTMIQINEPGVYTLSMRDNDNVYVYDKNVEVRESPHTANYHSQTSKGLVQVDTAGGLVQGDTAGGLVQGDTAGGLVQGDTAGGLVQHNTAGGLVQCDTAGGLVQGDTAGGLVQGDTAGGLVQGDTAGGLVQHGSAGGLVQCDTAGGLVQVDTAGGLVQHGSAGGLVQVDTAGGLVQGDTAGGLVQCDTAGILVQHDTAGGLVQGDTTGGLVQHDTAGGLVQCDTAGGLVQCDTAGGLVQGDTAGGLVQHGSAGGLVQVDTAGGLIQGDTAGGLVQSDIAGGLVLGDTAGGLVQVDTAEGLVQCDTAEGLVQCDTAGRLVQGDTAGGLVQRDTAGGLVQGDTAGGLVQCDTAGRLVQGDTAGGLVQRDTAGGLVQCDTAGRLVQGDTAGGLVQRDTAGGLVQCDTAGGLVQRDTAGGLVQHATAQVLVPKVSLSALTMCQEIGRGAFGIVHSAKWQGTTVAVKEIAIKRMKFAKHYIVRELHLHSKVRHPNIVLLMAYAMEKNSLYLISELIEGETLDDRLFGHESESMSRPVKTTVSRKITQAVAYLHCQDPVIIHRDIKPENILIADNCETVKLCDMGLSKLKTMTTVMTTMAGGSLQPGTPAYQAPEVLLDGKSASIATDIWSLSCTVTEVFTEVPIWNCPEDTDHDHIQYIIGKMKAKAKPDGLSVLATGDDTFCMLNKGLSYQAHERPNALEMVEILA